MKEISEGRAKVRTAEEEKVSKKLPVFYNPVMKLNRDISIMLLNALSSEKEWKIGLPLAGTGIRGIRFLKEVTGIKCIYMNDNNPDFLRFASDNLKLNNIPEEKTEYHEFLGHRQKIEVNDELKALFRPYNKQVVLSGCEANIFMMSSPGFDYIDIDPYGSPNPFLDAACKRLAREGILAVTATDTSALSGTYENACKRKYWAKPLHNELMHEVGLRILIRRVQLIGAGYEKALIPLISYSKDHYMRVFFRCCKGKAQVDKMLKQHDLFLKEQAGPLWTGKLLDKPLLEKMQGIPFTRQLLEESQADVIGFYDLHKLKSSARINDVIMMLKKEGFRATRTHLSMTGIRTDASQEELKKLLKSKNIYKSA